MSSIVGFASDVAATEALFTSLLVQSHAALRSEAAKAPPGSRARSRSFRSSFLLSFVARIDERLREVTAHVESHATSSQGAALLPALVDRENAVERLSDGAVRHARRALRARRNRRRRLGPGQDCGRPSSSQCRRRRRAHANGLAEPPDTRARKRGCRQVRVYTPSVTESNVG